MQNFELRHDELLKRCKAMDERVLSDARAVGGDDYALIAAASWRHVFGAHKLIATPNGEPALLSKECDSNGCIGTVDLSYPSSPIFVKYNPELVNALCRPIMEFASMPVWEYDFAPHDVGRYPYATGQIYDLVSEPRQGEVLPLYYMYPAGAGIYSGRNQMPVEENGNMLIMLAAALDAGADVALGLRLMPDDFYASETRSYLGKMNDYGLPLDSRGLHEERLADVVRCDGARC